MQSGEYRLYRLRRIWGQKNMGSGLAIKHKPRNMGSGLAIKHKPRTMSRPLRIEYAGALYHVTARGDRREDIYLDDEDRQAWLQQLAQVCRRFNWRCHAWCQMDNHYHILIETAEGNLSQGMRQLNGVYTQACNRRHQRVGHVFQGRYKAILVQKDSYLLELARYIVLNPVRAGMVKDVADWAWSSYHAMLNLKTAPEWLETDWLLTCFCKQKNVLTINILILSEKEWVCLQSGKI